MRLFHVISPRLSGMLILICFQFISCDKDDSIPSDFRDDFIGKYQVHKSVNSYGFPECGEHFSREQDTIISVTYGESDSTMHVLGREVYLDSAGWFSDYHYGLRLWNDSIYSHFMNGGLGCGQYEMYEGFKISSNP